jgi:hypothetical protein
MEANSHGLSPERIRHYNSETAHLLSLYLNLLPDIITPDAIEELARDIGVPREAAYALMLATVCGLDTAGRDRLYFEEYFLPMVREMDPLEFELDPYYQHIKIPTEALGRWELKTMALRPCEAFVRDDFCVYPDGRMIPQIGFFMREFPYPAVLEGGREWMTLMPNETVTTLPAVYASHGRVLTFGLGLGYFAFRASEREEVERVTVVELSEDAATLFKTHILPQFPHKEKVNVVVMDAFAFLDGEMKDGDYDFVFADIWHDVGDGRELYRRFKEYEPRFPRTEFTYWLEDTILCYERPELWE